MATQTYTDSVTLTAAAEFNKFDTAAYVALSGVAGTNTITATGPANYTLAATHPPIWFIPANTNTGATTINITPSGGAALGAKNIFANAAALVGGELVLGVPVLLTYDGTQFTIPSIPTFKAITGTRALDGGSGNVAYTGVGFRPRAIVFTAAINGTRMATFFGMAVGAVNYCTYDAQSGAGTYGTSGTLCIVIDEETGVKTQAAALSAYGSDGFTLTWTRTGATSAGTIDFYAVCFR